MDLQQLEYFLVCAEKGSLTKAAEALYTTQPHVSQVIRALERELGVSLFRRTASGVVPTPDGERIRFLAQNVCKNAAMIRETCAENRQQELRIAANASSRLAFLTEEFFCARTEEGLRLQYTECGIEAMMELLQLRRYDLGFLFLPANRLSAFSHMAARRHLRYTSLLQSDLVLHCGPESPFFGRESVSPAELDGLSCIQLEDDFFSVEELLGENEAFRTGKRAIRKVIRTNSDHLMLGVLQKTALCNIGSYWLRGGTGFSFSVIEGFENKVSFGYLENDNLPPSAQAQAFLAAVRETLEKR